MSWQSFVSLGMSSTNSNNEDGFLDQPKRRYPFDSLFRSEVLLTPDHFFRTLGQQSGDDHGSEDDYQRAVFLFQRLQSTRRMISSLSFFLVAASLVPFVCVELPEEWWLYAWAGGMVLAFFAGAVLYLAHSRWQAGRRDYCLWLKLVYRRGTGL